MTFAVHWTLKINNRSVNMSIGNSKMYSQCIDLTRLLVKAPIHNQ